MLDSMCIWVMLISLRVGLELPCQVTLLLQRPKQTSPCVWALHKLAIWDLFSMSQSVA